MKVFTRVEMMTVDATPSSATAGTTKIISPHQLTIGVTMVLPICRVN